MKAPVKVIKVSNALHFVLAPFDLAFVLRDTTYYLRVASQISFDGYIQLPLI